MQCLRKKVSHRFKCPETYRGKTPLLQHYRGVRRGRQCRVVCCIKGCNTLHKHTHQSVEDSAHTDTLHRPHMEVGPALALGISCGVSAEINGFSWSCHCFLPLFTQHPTLPLSHSHSPHSHMLPSHSSFTPCHPHTHTSLPHVTLTPSHSHLTPTLHPHTHHNKYKGTLKDGPCGAKKAQDDRPTRSHAL